MTENSWNWSTDRRIRSDPQCGQAIVLEILKQLEDHAWIQHDIFCVHLALEEAIVNAIKHGNGHDCQKMVHVVCKLAQDRIRIEIADEGEGFCPGEVPDPTDEEHLEIPSGRGIMLMRNFMSMVEYNASGNGVVMEKVRAHCD